MMIDDSVSTCERRRRQAENVEVAKNLGTRSVSLQRKRPPARWIGVRVASMESQCIAGSLTVLS